MGASASQIKSVPCRIHPCVDDGLCCLLPAERTIDQSYKTIVLRAKKIIKKKNSQSIVGLLDLSHLTGARCRNGVAFFPDRTPLGRCRCADLILERNDARPCVCVSYICTNSGWLCRVLWCSKQTTTCNFFLIRGTSATFNLVTPSSARVVMRSFLLVFFPRLSSVLHDASRPHTALTKKTR